MENKTSIKTNIKTNIENKTNLKTNIHEDVRKHIDQLNRENCIKNTNHFIIESRELPKPLTLSSLDNKLPQSVKLI